MLPGRQSADVVIAGAGIAGVAAALEALGRGRRVVLVDRDGEENLGGQAKEAEIQTVEERVITPTILASGSLTYQTEIRMVSEVMGRVKSLNVKEGDLVRQGDLLLRLDPATVQAQVDALEAGLRQSKLAIDRQKVASDNLEVKWKRYQQLRESGVIDANTYDEIRAQRASGFYSPAIFLLVAAFLLHLVMTRLVATQREQRRSL